MIALDVLYLKIYHMYLAKMHIETAIPKNVYVPKNVPGTTQYQGQHNQFSLLRLDLWCK